MAKFDEGYGFNPTDGDENSAFDFDTRRDYVASGGTLATWSNQGTEKCSIGAEGEWQGPVVDKGGAVYNVKHPDYGAIGDGSTDDTAAIQAAIDDAEAGGGGIVFVPGGDFLLSSPGLTIDTQKTYIVGEGQDSVLKGNGFTLLTIADAASGRGVGLADIMFWAETGNSSTICLQLGSDSGSGLTNWRLNNVHFSGDSAEGSGTAIKGIFAIRGRAVGCSMTQWNKGIELVDDSGGRSSNSNSFHGNNIRRASVGVEITNANGNDFYGCLLEDNDKGMNLSSARVGIHGGRLENGPNVNSVNVDISDGVLRSFGVEYHDDEAWNADSTALIFSYADRFTTSITVDGAGTQAVLYEPVSEPGTYNGTGNVYVHKQNEFQVVRGGNFLFNQNSGGATVFQEAGTSRLVIDSQGRLDFRGTHGTSTKDPTTTAPDEWVQIKMPDGSTYYLPAYLA